MKIEEKAKTDFSDWLVASDIDGTLNNKLRRLPKRNYDRICEFVLEKKAILRSLPAATSVLCASRFKACRFSPRRRLF